MNPFLIGFLYRRVLKPILFCIPPDNIHEIFTGLARFLGKYQLTRAITDFTFNYQNKLLEKEILGIKFKNPIGLSAGYDYNGYFIKMLPHVGFGFVTVGTVTNLPSRPSPGPMFARLPKSKSLLVNKGFTSEGAEIVAKRLNDPYLKDVTFGVSVGISHSEQIISATQAIEDVTQCFKKMETSPFIKYYELNISNPNANLSNVFLEKDNFSELINNVLKLNIKRPIFVKLPNEIDVNLADDLVEITINAGIRGFVFCHLVADRKNPAFNPSEIQKVSRLNGNFSGRPAWQGSNRLIEHFRRKYGNEIVIIGSGGIFTPQDAKEKLEMGADLIQVITGLIYEGPQLPNEINRFLAKEKATS